MHRRATLSLLVLALARYGPALILDPGVDDVFFAQGKVLAGISQTNGRAPDKIRVKLLVDDKGATDLLQSVKVTVTGVRFNQ